MVSSSLPAALPGHDRLVRAVDEGTALVAGHDAERGTFSKTFLVGPDAGGLPA
jgi:hypothetical protein